MPDNNREPSTSVAVAAVVAVINGIWTAGLMLLTVFSAATCGDAGPGEQQCGGELGLVGLWVMGQGLLFIPMVWAARLLTDPSTDQDDGVVRAGQIGVATAILIPAVLLTLLLLSSIVAGPS